MINQKVCSQFETLLYNLNMEADFAESECSDMRYDFEDGTVSVWIRAGISLEGAMPKRTKTKVKKWCKEHHIQDDLNFY